MNGQFLRYFLGFLLLIILKTTTSSSYVQVEQDRGDLCSRCHGNTTNCTKQERQQGRCCVDHSDNVVGLDLSNCSLTTVPNFGSVKDIRWLLLENNPGLQCSGSSFHKCFEGLTKLAKVVLPSRCDCVGGSSVWQRHFNRSDAKWCLGQKNSTCKDFNITCPANSNCLPNGPGLTECLCSTGWFGYRCLVKHGFPLAVIFGSMAGTALLVMVVLCVLQRKRKKSTSQGYTWVPEQATL